MTHLGVDLAQRYDVYDVAYLAGGPARVADAAVVALVRSGRIRAHASGRLSTRAASSRHPVEAAVLDLVGPRERRSIGTVRWRLAEDDRLAAVARRLAGDGLIRAAAPWWAPGRAVSRTHAGRRLLRDLVAHVPADRIAPETGAMAVALGGAARLGDDELYRRVFAPPRPSRASRNADRIAGRERIPGSPHAYARNGALIGSDGGWGGGWGGAWGGGGGWGDGGCGGAGDGGGGGGGDGGGGGC